MSAATPDRHDAELGRRVRARRQALGLRQIDLASALGVSCQQIQKYEAGQNRMAAMTAYRAARALKLPIQTLFSGIDADLPASPR